MFKLFRGKRGAIRFTSGKLAFVPAIGLLAFTQPFRPIVVDGISMAPTYGNHEILLTKPFAGQIQKGDVIVFHSPMGNMIKRVAFLPGDKVLQFYMLNHWSDILWDIPKRKPHRGKFRTRVIPPGMIFVLGDNRPASVDSRTFGLVPVTDIDRVVVDPKPFIPPPDKFWPAW